MKNKVLKRFLQSTSGNIAMTFSLLAFPMVVLVGGGLDVQRIAHSKLKLQSAVEASALAAASFKNKGLSTIDSVNGYLNANVADGVYFKGLEVEVTNEELSSNLREITVHGEAIVESTFLQLIGINQTRITASSTAVEARGNIEYSLVLDVSSSMNGARLASLKVAAADFIDLVLDEEQVDTTSINLIPFGGSVNIGPLFNDFAVANSNAIVNPSAAQYSVNANIPDSAFRFTDGGNCIELSKDDYDLDLIPANSRGQIPHFWKWWFFNPWCPASSSEAVWNSNDANLLKDRINSFSLSDGTGMNHGALWGAKGISPAFRGKLGGDFPNRPADFDDEDTKKVIVIMTDGGITQQFRPEDYRNFNVHTNRHIGETDSNSDSVRAQGNNANQQVALNSGNAADDSLSETAVGEFRKTCEDLQSQGVSIYTVGFQISENSLQEILLQDCATNPANYFLVESLDISEAFRSIVSSVNKLRVSG